MHLSIYFMFTCIVLFNLLYFLKEIPEGRVVVGGMLLLLLLL